MNFDDGFILIPRRFVGSRKTSSEPLCRRQAETTCQNFGDSLLNSNQCVSLPMAARELRKLSPKLQPPHALQGTPNFNTGGSSTR